VSKTEKDNQNGRQRPKYKTVSILVHISITARYNYKIARCEFESRSWRGVLYTILCDKVCQGLATDRWFSPGFSVSSTNKTDTVNIVESDVTVNISLYRKLCRNNCVAVDIVFTCVLLFE
jgi:hypothetical protein